MTLFYDETVTISFTVIARPFQLIKMIKRRLIVKKKYFLFSFSFRVSSYCLSINILSSFFLILVNFLTDMQHKLLEVIYIY